VGQELRSDVKHPETGDVIASAGTVVDESIKEAIVGAGITNVRIVPFVTDRIEYLSADREDEFVIAQANTPLDDGMHFTSERVSARRGSQFTLEPAERIDYMDVSPKQVVSVAAALIPF